MIPLKSLLVMLRPQNVTRRAEVNSPNAASNHIRASKSPKALCSSVSQPDSSWFWKLTHCVSHGNVLLWAMIHSGLRASVLCYGASMKLVVATIAKRLKKEITCAVLTNKNSTLNYVSIMETHKVTGFSQKHQRSLCRFESPVT